MPEPTPEQIRQIGDAIAAGNKIEAIKLYRTITGSDLKDAKDFIENLTAELREKDPVKFAAPSSRKGCMAVLLVFIIFLALVLMVRAEDGPQSGLSPQFTASSLVRGSVVSRQSYVRTVGATGISQYSQETKRIAAVKIQIRSFKKPQNPYEIQCFFVARSPQRQRYVYDAVKTLSQEQFDEINIFSRDLFGGAFKIQQTTTQYFGTTNPLDTQNVTVNTLQGAAQPGSKVEGWIVRALMDGKVLRVEASLPELKKYAVAANEELDDITSKIKMSK